MTLYARLRAAWGRARDVRTKCWHVVGYEPCCCGDVADCINNGEGWPIWCHKPISRVRWVLVGHCGQHQEQP